MGGEGVSSSHAASGLREQSWLPRQGFPDGPTLLAAGRALPFPVPVQTFGAGAQSRVHVGGHVHPPSRAKTQKASSPTRVPQLLGAEWEDPRLCVLAQRPHPVRPHTASAARLLPSSPSCGPEHGRASPSAPARQALADPCGQRLGQRCPQSKRRCVWLAPQEGGQGGGLFAPLVAPHALPRPLDSVSSVSCPRRGEVAAQRASPGSRWGEGWQQRLSHVMMGRGWGPGGREGGVAAAQGGDALGVPCGHRPLRGHRGATARVPWVSGWLWSSCSSLCRQGRGHRERPSSR